MAIKEYYAEYWLKELQKSMDRCTGHHDITEILLKTALKHHTINHTIIEKHKNLKFWDRVKRQKIPDRAQLIDCMDMFNAVFNNIAVIAPIHAFLEFINPFLNKPWFLHVCSTSL